MVRRRFLSCFGLIAMLSAGAAAAAGCADEDPKYGPPEAIRGRKIDYPGFTGATEPAEEGGTNLTPAQAAFKTLFTAIGSPPPAGSCQPCHSSGQTGVKKFLLPTAEETRALFKTEGYDNVASTFYTKPAHSGPALTPAQKQLVDAWIAAEGTGGTTPADGGGG